ncbi:MAG TPA: TetR/AcrR family transcriptional regulator [Chloroflexota bacterium]|nr:TetR/AcrR family transcriptional regulator [Chloroflexota bacterium]
MAVPTDPTRKRILDAAEPAFAEHGFAGTSLRALTRQARVNLAAIHYHFGSKEALLRAVLDRIVAPVNRERLAGLDRLEAEAGDRALTVEEILAAFLRPALDLIRDLGERGRILARFLGRSATEPTELVQAIVHEQFGEVGIRYLAALERALPTVPPGELFWRFKCVIGVLTFLLADPTHLTSPLGAERSQDSDVELRRLVAFLAPGVGAPATFCPQS